jgi:hypothetical protein
MRFVGLLTRRFLGMGKGNLGRRVRGLGGQKVVYSAFGQVVEGKVRVERPVPPEEKKEDGKED